MLPDLNTDCRQFRWDRPCAPHKARGVTCPTCDVYDPIGARVLVVKLDALGDVLRTTALVPAIAAAFPRCHLTWLTAPGAVALFGGNGAVDEVLSTADPLTAARLAHEEWDAVLCPDADPAAAAWAAAARAATRRGFCADARGRVQPLGPGAEHWLAMGLSDVAKRANRETYQSLIAAVLDLDAGAIGEPVLVLPAAEVAAAHEWRAGLGFGGMLIGLNTGAGGRWAYKQWTLPHQQTFLAEATARGYGVVLLGGPEEIERHRALIAHSGSGPVFDAGTGHTVGGFAARLEQCAVVVTGDTFALHVAVARRVPVVALFGPTSSAEIELYGRGEKIVPEDLDCLCCYLPSCQVTPHCQARITPDRVLAAALRLAGPHRAAPPARSGNRR